MPEVKLWVVSPVSGNALLGPWSGADTGFQHGGAAVFLASLLSLPLPWKRGSGVLPRKILKFYIAVGEF